VSKNKTKFIFVALLLCQILAGSACTRFGCTEKSESDVKAPDGVLVATVLTSDCGATTDYSTTVNLHRSDHSPDESGGNIFVAMGQHRVTLQWSGQDILIVQCGDCDRKNVIRMTTVLGRTNINYELPAYTPKVASQN
jgi:hypothetical protein